MKITDFKVGDRIRIDVNNIFSSGKFRFYESAKIIAHSLSKKHYLIGFKNDSFNIFNKLDYKYFF